MNNRLQANFVKSFGRFNLNAELDIHTDQFSVTVLVGPSGSGKTTFLRCLSGLEQPESGRIAYANECWFDAQQRKAVPPQARQVGYLFQDYALFPHLSVIQNVSFGLAVRSRELVADMLGRFQLTDLENRYPRQLSGGERQRVALARVLVRQPRLLLLDEPLSALDGPTRLHVRTELRGMLANAGIPTVIVSHDRVETMALADEVIVIDSGTIRQRGSVDDTFLRPLDERAAAIVGMETVIRGMIHQVVDGLATVKMGRVHLLAIAPLDHSQQVFVCIRAEDVTLELAQPAAASSARNHLPGHVTSVKLEGPVARIGLDVGFALESLLTRPAAEELGLQPGRAVVAVVKATAIHLIPRGA